jgi:glycerol-3-phosphate cytidylyltransferase
MTTVATFGTFDLFHIGHLRILERAAQLGDRLVVGISTDELNFAKKQKYPIVPQDERRALVAALRCVDDTFWEHSLDEKRDYLTAHKADVLVMGHDWEGRFDEFRDVVRVVYLPRTETISTTWLEKFIRERDATQQRNAIAGPEWPRRPTS